MSSIPVYEVRIPEYILKTSNDKSPIIKNLDYDVEIPEFYEKNKPDFVSIGSKIDNCLKEHFLGKEVVIRVLGSQEHQDKSLNEMVDIIKQLGYDRYDKTRVGDRYENIENKAIDFFALDFKVESNGIYFQYFLEPFYYWPLQDRGIPVRIDIAIIYDPIQLEVIEHQYKGREGEIKKDGFVFKNQNDKPKAILGVIKIL